MKKIIALISLFVFLAFFVSPALTQNPQIILSSNEVNMFNIPPNNQQSIDLTIKNIRDVRDTLSITIFPTYWNYIDTFLSKTLIELESGETETLKISFTAQPEASFGSKAFTITITSTKNPEISSNQTLILQVLRSSPVFVLELVSNKFAYDPEETAAITTTITNIGNVPSEEYALQTTITKNGETIKRFDNFVTSIAEKSKRSFINEYTFEKYATPGTYSISSILKNSLGFTISSKSINLKVNEVYKLPTEYTSKKVSIGFLAVSIEIKIKNEGNVKTPSFYVNESVPSFAKDLFDPEVEPNFQILKNGRIVYGWLIPTLQPKQEVTIRYQFRMWHVWLGLLVIGAIVYFAFKFVFAPTAIKKYKHFGPITGKKEILVTIEARNRSMQEIRDLVIRDFAPAIVKVVPRFDTVRPAMKESAAGTELIWKFDSLKAGEERVLTYRIKPVIDIIGTLRLPSVEIRYTDKKKRKKIIASRSLIIKSR